MWRPAQLLGAVVLLAQRSAVVAKKPHICFILADDWGQYNAGYRGDPDSRTPAVDSLAAEGLVLERFYVHKWCAPTRSALMTGRNPMHTGLDPLNWTSTINKRGGDSALSADYIFIPRLLQSAGYESHMLGKWHLGSFLQAYTPVGRGFNTSFGFLGGYETYDTHMLWNGRVNYSREAAGVPNGWYTDPYITDLYESDHAATDPRYNGTCTSKGVCTCVDGSNSNICRYSSYMYTEKSVGLIETAAMAPATPRFWYFAIQSVHSPYQISEEYLERFSHLPPPVAGCGEPEQPPCISIAHRMHAMVAALDDFIGNTTETLKRTGLWGETLLILHADNGAVQARGAHSHNVNGVGGFQGTGGTAYPYRGAKFNVWEGGTRTPAILAGGYLPTSCHGKQSHAFMHVADWMATLAAVAGVPATALAHANASGPKPLDSHDLSSLLFSDEGRCGADRTQSPRQSLMYFYGDDENGAYASGDFKLVMGIDHKWGLWDQQFCLAANYSWPNRTGAEQDGQCDNPPGPAPCPSAKPCLFNVVDDIRELHDLSAEQPERLKSIIAQYREAGETDCWKTHPEDGCQAWTTPEQEQALSKQTRETMWLAPIGHAPRDWHPPSVKTDDNDEDAAAILHD